MTYQEILKNDPCNQQIKSLSLLTNLIDKLRGFIRTKEVSHNNIYYSGPYNPDKYNSKNLEELQAKALILLRRF